MNETPRDETQRDETGRDETPRPAPKPGEAPIANEPLRPEDFYREGDCIVFTAAYHLRRGYCCNSDCRHCPYK
jgi:hypothetical protein